MNKKRKRESGSPLLYIWLCNCLAEVAFKKCFTIALKVCVDALSGTPLEGSKGV